MRSKLGNSFGKIINRKVSSKRCQTMRWASSFKSLLASEANSESFQTSKMELFVKLIKNEKPFTVFTKTSIWIFDKVLNMLLNRFPKLRMFHFYNNANVKEPTELQNSWTKRLWNRSNSKIYQPYVAQSDVSQYLIGKKFVGKKWWTFRQMTNMFTDE